MDNKDDLLFYNEYEEFYSMVKHSSAFRAYCKDAFGEDFSQDGFSDINQIKMILNHIPSRKNVHVLDVGCGNGKMLGYLQNQKECFIHGFDYSKQAIQAAQVLNPLNSEFKQGIIGDIEYDDDFFDLVISMDTIYFAKDMSNFVAQVMFQTQCSEEALEDFTDKMARYIIVAKK